MKTQLLILTFFTLLSCSKKNDPELKPIDKLPPLTHIGANTAGCLVNGEAFLPKGYMPSGILTCNYINQIDFDLLFHDSKSNVTKSIYINTKLENLEINKIYYLNKRREFNSSQYAEYHVSNTNKHYSTTSTVTGELIITHHDYNNATISGVFWFDAISSNGEKIEVREGRFDMEY